MRKERRRSFQKPFIVRAYTTRDVLGTTNLKYLLLEHKSFVTLEEE
jgi:hypothetical protein